MISWTDFEKIDIRTGTIIAATTFEKAKKPAYKLKIDFGKEGIKNSSAQITVLYSIDELIGKQIVAVINFPPKQIANFISECLVLGVYNENNDVVLLMPDMGTENGKKIG
jgi:tRNA-binding protein